jgi:HemY protein
MLNLLLLLFFLTCLGITAGWLAENPGNVTIYWFDYRIDTSFSFLLALALVLTVVLSYAYVLLRRLILAPGNFSERRGLKQHRRGLTEITYSVAALAAADVKSAELHTRRAETLLGRTPLTLLLSAQIARSQGDDARTRLLLDQMLDYKETEYIAARSLSDAASKQEIFPEALHMAERAHAINPKDIKNLFGLHLRLGHWQQAHNTIKRAIKKHHITRSEARHFRCLVYVTQGTQLLETEQFDDALKIANLAIKEAPDYLPAVLFAARTYVAVKDEPKATKLIMRSWGYMPHPQLAGLLLSLISKQPKDAQMKQVQKLAACNPDSIESALAVTQAAIHNKLWDLAYQTLQKVIIREESVRACHMMAVIEQGISADPNAGGKWFTRSQVAQADPEWVCSSCSHASDRWSVNCPSCNEIDSMEWKKRQVKYAVA